MRKIFQIKKEKCQKGVRRRVKGERGGAVWKRELFQFRRQTTICAQKWRQFCRLAAFLGRVSGWVCFGSCSWFWPGPGLPDALEFSFIIFFIFGKTYVAKNPTLKKEWNISTYIYIYIYENHLIQFYTQCLCLRMAVGRGGGKFAMQIILLYPEAVWDPSPIHVARAPMSSLSCEFLSCSCSVSGPFFQKVNQ